MEAATGTTDPQRLREAIQNTRTYEFNKNQAREAKVDKIVSGTAELGKVKLYPVHCSHQSLLGIDDKLKGRHPEWEPPVLLRGHRWVNPHVGWDGKDPVKGWPSSDYPQFVGKGVRPLYS
jgi:hypothetical protein